MPMTPVAAFAQTPDTASALLTAAVGGLNTPTPTNTVQAFTAGANGAIVTRITAMPRGTNTATAIYLFKSIDTGSTWHLKDAETMAAQPSVAPAIAPNETTFANYSQSRPMILGAGEILSFGLGVAQTNGVDVDVEFTNF